MKILGRVVSTKPITLSRAAKLISRFAAVENGSSPAVSLYLQRAADAFNHLVQSQEKRSKRNTKTIQTSQINDGDAAAEAPATKKKKKGKSIEAILDSENFHVVRESEYEITRDMPPTKKKRKRGGDASLDSTEKVSEDLVRETGKAIVNDGDSTAPAKKKKKKKRGGDASLDSTEKVSEDLVRETGKAIVNDGDSTEAPAKKKKKKKKRGGDASLDSTEKVSEDLVRETGKAIVNDGDSTEAPAKKKKKKKNG